jgi:nicotinamidase-related amidase
METEKLAATLRHATDSGTLTGLFIDTQKVFHCPETAPAFEGAAKLARALRSHYVGREFFAWPKKTPDLNGRSLSGKAHDFSLDGGDDFAICKPECYETLHIKPGFSVLTNSDFAASLERTRTPVLLMAGVLASACVKISLRDIMNKHAGAQIILAHDATDLNGQAPEDYIRAALEGTKASNENQSRVQVASVEAISSLLNFSA